MKRKNGVLDSCVKTTSIAALLLISATMAWADVLNLDTQDDYGTNVSRKLGRGVSNMAFGWVDVFKGVEDVYDEHNYVAAVTWGPIYGLGKAVTRTLAGAYEAATFPVALPGDFEPIVEPEFVLDSK